MESNECYEGTDSVYNNTDINGENNLEVGYKVTESNMMNSLVGEEEDESNRENNMRSTGNSTDKNNNEINDMESELPEDSKDSDSIHGRTDKSTLKIPDTTEYFKQRPPRPKKRYVIPQSHEYQPDPRYNEDTLEKFIRAIKSSQKEPEMSAIKPTIDYCNHMTKKKVDEKDYDGAIYYESAADFLRKFVGQNSLNNLMARSKEETDFKIENAKQKINEINQKWDSIFRQTNESHRKLMEGLLQRNRDEQNQFEAKCASSEFLNQCNKPSSQLLSLRSMEQTYATAKLFERAKAVKRQADLLEGRETLAARSRATEDAKIQYATLIAKQENAINCLKQYCGKERRSLELKKQKELFGWESLVRRCEAQEHKPRPKCDPLTSSRPLKHNQMRQSAHLSIGAITIKDIVKTPKVMSPRIQKGKKI